MGILYEPAIQMSGGNPINEIQSFKDLTSLKLFDSALLQFRLIAVSLGFKLT